MVRESRENKKLTGIQLKAARLAAEGLTEVEIAQQCDRSRDWVRKLKQEPAFDISVEAFKDEIEESIKRAIGGENLPEVQAFKKKIIEDSKELHELSRALIRKIKERVDYLDPDEIKVDKISPLLKQATDGLTVSANLDRQVLGLDQLLEEIDNVAKASGISTGKTD